MKKRDKEESYEEYEKRLEKMDFIGLTVEDMNISRLRSKIGHYEMYMRYRCWCGKRMRLVPGKMGDSGLYQCPKCKSMRWITNEQE